MNILIPASCLSEEQWCGVNWYVPSLSKTESVLSKLPDLWLGWNGCPRASIFLCTASDVFWMSNVVICYSSCLLCRKLVLLITGCMLAVLVLTLGHSDKSPANQICCHIIKGTSNCGLNWKLEVVIFAKTRYRLKYKTKVEANSLIYSFSIR